MDNEKFYEVISKEMLSFYNQHRDQSYSVLLSGGYDSRFVLYMCLDLNIPISKCYTFSLDDALSTDAQLAKKVCEQENIDLEIVKLPTNSTEVIPIMEELAQKYKCETKTDFECTFPLLCVYRTVKEDVILTGTDADCYFGLGLKYALHYKNLEDGLTKYRNDMFNGRSNGQLTQRAILNETYHKLAFDPFYQFEVRKLFENTTWDELNKPYKKGPLYIKFKDRYDAIKPYRSSYQCGDSGIRELCQMVMIDSKYNTRNYKSVVGCYNELVRRLKYHDSNSRKLF